MVEEKVRIPRQLHLLYQVRDHVMTFMLSCQFLRFASPQPCLRNPKHSCSSRKLTRGPTLLPGGLLLLLRNSRKLATYISRQPTPTNWRNSSEKQVTLSPVKPNAESNARRQTKLLMPGGMLPKLTRKDIQNVSCSEMVDGS